MNADVQRLIDAQRAATERALQYPEEFRPMVEQMARIAAVTSSTPREGWAYPSYEDLVLTLGTVASAPLRAVAGGFERMEAKQCYVNALTLAMDHGELTYVEGYATTGMLVVNHAWVVDEDGTIIDPTWQGRLAEHGTRAQYAGVRFATQFAVARTQELEQAGVIASDWLFRNAALIHGFVVDDDGVVVDGVNEHGVRTMAAYRESIR